MNFKPQVAKVIQVKKKSSWCSQTNKGMNQEVVVQDFVKICIVSVITYALHVYGSHLNRLLGGTWFV